MQQAVDGLLKGIVVAWPLLVTAAGILVLLIVLMSPMPGRGPRGRRRDQWRSFKFEARRIVLQRAGGACEAAAFIVWGRCGDPAVEVDHVYPWSKGGPTVVSNGQALCRGHNRSKSNLTPPWWYIRGLERRRSAYFPASEDVRVFAVMNADERAAREAWIANKGRQRGRLP